MFFKRRLCPFIELSWSCWTRNLFRWIQVPWFLLRVSKKKLFIPIHSHLISYPNLSSAKDEFDLIIFPTWWYRIANVKYIFHSDISIGNFLKILWGPVHFGNFPVSAAKVILPFVFWPKLSGNCLIVVKNTYIGLVTNVKGGKINFAEMLLKVPVSTGINKEIIKLGYPIDGNVRFFNIWLYLRKVFLPEWISQPYNSILMDIWPCQLSG